jgi:stage III sporulation protein AC
LRSSRLGDPALVAIRAQENEKRRNQNLDITLITRIAGIGILVAVASQILSKTGRDEQATFVTIAGIIVALMLLIDQIRELFDAVMNLFGM